MSFFNTWWYKWILLTLPKGEYSPISNLGAKHEDLFIWCFQLKKVVYLIQASIYFSDELFQHMMIQMDPSDFAQEGVLTHFKPWSKSWRFVYMMFPILQVHFVFKYLFIKYIHILKL